MNIRLFICIQPEEVFLLMQKCGGKSNNFFILGELYHLRDVSGSLADDSRCTHAILDANYYFKLKMKHSVIHKDF